MFYFCALSALSLRKTEVSVSSLIPRPGPVLTYPLYTNSYLINTQNSDPKT